MKKEIKTEQELIEFMGDYGFIYSNEFEQALEDLYNGVKIKVARVSSNWIKRIPDDTEV